jgi:acyl carrier protein
VYDKLKSIMVRELLLKADDIRPDATLAEAGMDSLAMVELAMVLSKRYGAELSDDELIETATVADIANLLATRASAALTPTNG